MQRDAALEAEIDAVYRSAHPDVLGYLTALVGHPQDAEEIAAEVFARALVAWRQSGSLPPAPMAWLMAAGRRLAIDRWRKGVRRARKIVGAPRATSHQPSEAIDVLDWFASLSAVLTSRQREAVVLRYQGMLSDDEIGRILGLSASGVRSLVGRAIAVLRDHPEVWQ